MQTLTAQRSIPAGPKLRPHGFPRPQRLRSKSRASRSSQLTAARAASPTRAPLRSRSCRRSGDLPGGAGPGGPPGRPGDPGKLTEVVPGWVGFAASASVLTLSGPPLVNVIATIPNLMPLFRFSVGQT